MYHWLARKGYTTPELRWHRNRWGCELKLSPFYALDCAVISQGTYDAEIHAFLERVLKPGMVCLDVGANIGEIALHAARRVTPGGVVHAFEPAPHVLERLRENVKRNGLEGTVRIWPVALSETTGKAQFSFAEPATCNQGMGSLVNRHNSVVGQEIEVETWSLDDFLREKQVGRVDIMKVDIQGAEWLLLKGGQCFFTERGPDLLIEVSDEDLRCLGRSGRDLCVLLESYGYHLWQLGGKSLDATTLSPEFSAGNIFCSRKSL